MIYNLCNQGNEQNNTFANLSIIKKSSLAAFNHLASDTTVQTIITNIADSSDVINTDLLPENISVSYTTLVDDNGKSYRLSTSFIITPLDKNLQDLLEQYNNQQVILLLKKHNATFLYGTPTSPLLLTYSEQHSNQAQGLKGYAVRISGECLGASKQFEEIEFDIFNRGLAFELAGSL